MTDRAVSLVDMSAVADYVGLETIPPPDPIRHTNVAVNVSLVNLAGTKYANVRDLERTFRLFGRANPSLFDLLESVADQLVTAAGMTPRRN